jgi:hypothetical protein
MPSHALDQRLFERTNSLADEDGSITASPQDGIELIDGWLSVISGNTSTQIIEEELKELRSELTLDEPDTDRVQQLLLNLADNITLLGQSRNVQEQVTNKLDTIGFTLRTLAGL